MHTCPVPVEVPVEVAPPPAPFAPATTTTTRFFSVSFEGRGLLSLGVRPGRRWGGWGLGTEFTKARSAGLKSSGARGNSGPACSSETEEEGFGNGPAADSMIYLGRGRCTMSWGETY